MGLRTKAVMGRIGGRPWTTQDDDLLQSSQRMDVCTGYRRGDTTIQRRAKEIEVKIRKAQPRQT
jgi:hypothetical protein